MKNIEIVRAARAAGFYSIQIGCEVLIWMPGRPIGRLEVEAAIDVPFECMTYFSYGVIAYGTDA